ncbi:MAG: carboxypeptidase-like regulatory domain-containing protein, partial [Planctomycetota bacterium]
IPPGTIRVRLDARERGYLAGEEIAVGAGDDDVRLVARQGETISGRVLHADGTPTVFATVRAKDAEGKVAGETHSLLSEGKFALRGLPRGAYTLEAEAYASDFGAGKRLDGSLAEVATGSTEVEIRLAP